MWRCYPSDQVFLILYRSPEWIMWERADQYFTITSLNALSELKSNSSSFSSTSLISSYSRDAQISQKSVSLLKVLGINVRNLVICAIWCPGFVHPTSTLILLLAIMFTSYQKLVQWPKSKTGTYRYHGCFSLYMEKSPPLQIQQFIAGESAVILPQSNK